MEAISKYPKNEEDIWDSDSLAFKNGEEISRRWGKSMEFWPKYLLMTNLPIFSVPQVDPRK